ncbi:MAG TPA: 3'-5' exonuclease, partial [Tepidisphaeraceae bacterium]
IYHDTALLAFVSGLPDGAQRVANLGHLHDRARQFESFNRPTVARFLHFLGGIEDEGDIGMPAVAGTATNAVRIMSIHKSKGLEFPVVILPDLGKGFNLRDAETKLIVDDCVGIAARVVDADKEVHYASIGAVLAQAEVRRKALAEELRVLYVAATRAKECLILIGTGVAGSIDAADAEWSSHRGAIDAGDVLAGGCMLDWILPASSVVEATAPGSFDRHEHTAADVEAWADALLVRRAPDAAAGLIANLKPLLGPVRADAVAKGAIDRLSFAYPFDKMTGEPAAASVTNLTKRGKSFVVSDPGRRTAVKVAAGSLHLPRCVEQTGRTRPEDVGTATHALLQRLDFARAQTVEDLHKQAVELVAKRFIRKDLLRAIDYDGVAWLLGTELGRRMRDAAPGALVREVDVVYAAPREDDPTGGDPRDRVMVRGRLDAMLIGPDGVHVIDYKTDRVSSEAVATRAEFYEGQIAAYGEAVTRIAGVPLVAATLAFITPRVLRTVGAATRSEA